MGDDLKISGVAFVWFSDEGRCGLAVLFPFLGLDVRPQENWSLANSSLAPAPSHHGRLARSLFSFEVLECGTNHYVLDHYAGTIQGPGNGLLDGFQLRMKSYVSETWYVRGRKHRPKMHNYYYLFSTRLPRGYLCSPPNMKGSNTI